MAAAPLLCRTQIDTRLLQRLDATPGPLLSRLQTVLEANLVAEESIRYADTGGIGFTAESRGRTVVPVIVAIGMRLGMPGGNSISITGPATSRGFPSLGATCMRNPGAAFTSQMAPPTSR